MYFVHGLTRSYFTRKVTGHLDYTDRPWRLEPGFVLHRSANDAGWNGGIPVVVTPDDVPIWDSTSIICHLDQLDDTPPERRVIPDDPTLQFLAFLLDDFSDEWFYRPAVGSRWCYPENTEAAGWQIAQELATVVPMPGAFVRANVVETMTNSLPRLGVVDGTIDTWMDATVVPWMRALDAHLAHSADGASGYLFGGRPSIADFAIFGANEAHFVGDPWCRAVVDEHGPAVVDHTRRLAMPQLHTFGDWIAADAVPDTLIAVLAEAGRHYLPWVAEATRTGSAEVTLADGVVTTIATSGFLTEARGIMLARYVAARSPELDAILERAGILRWFADHIDEATAVPDMTAPPQPADNRPYSVE